ncbi:MAG TPA: hypothetical protein VH598_06915, partial [Verrucomicrobiae bacterium]|nr:hypothetical protein [Verrucomicrobiae bacterium]
DLCRADLDEILREAGQAFRNRETLRGQMETRMTEIKKSVLNLFSAPELIQIIPQALKSGQF